MRGVAAAVITACLLGAGAAGAATVVAMARAGDRPLADAVVTLTPLGIAPDGRPATGDGVMRQHDERFDPFVVAISTGSRVRFPNDDDVRHHVYSFSPAKPFELRLYGRDETPSVLFDRPGIVAVGCNIHDTMRGYVYVTYAPWFGVTDGEGLAPLTGIPAGRYRVDAWHPDQRRAMEPMEITVAGTDVEVVLPILAGQGRERGGPDPERGAY